MLCLNLTGLWRSKFDLHGTNGTLCKNVTIGWIDYTEPKVLRIPVNYEIELFDTLQSLVLQYIVFWDEGSARLHNPHVIS